MPVKNVALQASLFNKLSLFLRGKRFLTDALTLIVGTALTQSISILTLPILTRLYGPEDFGMWALYVSIVSILAVLASWRYELAIMLPDQDREAINVLVLSILITVIMSVVTLIIMFFFRYQIALILKAPQLSSWLWWVALSMLVIGLYQSLSYWNSRKRQFKRLAISSVGQSGSTVATQIGVGTLNSGLGGLIGGQIVGQVIATVILGTQIRKEGTPLLRGNFKFSQILQNLSKYRKFPLYSSWGALINVAKLQMVPVLLSIFFSTAIVGFYILGSRIVYLPMSLIGNQIGVVFYQKASEEWNKTRNISKVFEKVISIFLMISIFPFIFLILFSPMLCEIFLGKQWLTVGQYAQILCPMFFMQFITSPVSIALTVVEKQEIQATMQFLFLFLTIVSLCIGGIFIKNSFICLVLYSAFQSLFYFVYLYVSLRVLSASVGGIIKEGLMWLKLTKQI
jgi:O-antigen/teichoic acid export membrane protein